MFHRLRQIERAEEFPRGSLYPVVLNPICMLLGLPFSAQGESAVLTTGVISALGREIESVNELFLILERHKVGDAVSVTVLRDGKRQQVKVTLEALN